MLPNVQRAGKKPNLFPTRWQAVLFHNYGLVPAQRLAYVLGCDTETIEHEAKELGLIPMLYNPLWDEKGYITLIRNNWYLLDYDQLCLLLDVDAKKLDFILQNDDFLAVKLGGFKPDCEKVSYYALTSEERAQTKALAMQIAPYVEHYKMPRFAFFHKEESVGRTVQKAGGKRIIHGYLTPCGDAFIEDSVKYMPDELLEQYARLGINGVWLHGSLSALSPYPFDETLSKAYPVRRQNLQRLIERCQGYGIKVYLYFNEPRALPENKFGKYAHLIGRRENGYAALCFEHAETRAYLYNAVKDLLSNVQGLGGIITITMSENLTHCNYRPQTNCPICKDIPPERSAAAVNNVIQAAIQDSGSNAELIANLWGWSPYMEWTEAQTLRGVELLDKNISVMCVSEYDLEIEKGGIKSRIIDYSMSNPGPSEITKKTLKKAQKAGHKIYAKIQTNNSWECSAVPYLPIFDLLYEHLTNLSEIDVGDYMLTWTLGGYPSPMFSLVSAYAASPKTFHLEQWYKDTFGDAYKQVWAAVKSFCEGIKEYPFSIDALYFSPKTLGCANVWSLTEEEQRSTMVCYAFDDYENWIKPYPIDVYLSQYEKLLRSWEQGRKCLENCEGLGELSIFAHAAYAHFKSDYLHTKFAYLKRDKRKNLQALSMILLQEKDNASQLLKAVYNNACIGYEASNHYYYTDRNLLEKIVWMDVLNQRLKEGE